MTPAPAALPPAQGSFLQFQARLRSPAKLARDSGIQRK